MEQPPKLDRKIDVIKLQAIIQKDYTEAQKRYVKVIKDYVLVLTRLRDYLSSDMKSIFKLSKIQAKNNLIIGSVLLTLSVVVFSITLFKDISTWMQLLYGGLLGTSLMFALHYFNKVRTFLLYKKEYFQKISALRKEAHRLKREIPKNGQPPRRTP